MSLDAVFRGDAVALALEYGKDAVLQQNYQGGTPYDPTNFTVDYDVRIMPPYGVEMNVDSNLFHVDDVLIALPAKGLTVAPGDPGPNGENATYSMKVDGQTYQTISIKKLYSGDQIAVYIFQCRN